MWWWYIFLSALDLHIFSSSRYKDGKGTNPDWLIMGHYKWDTRGISNHKWMQVVNGTKFLTDIASLKKPLCEWMMNKDHHKKKLIYHNPLGPWPPLDHKKKYTNGDQHRIKKHHDYDDLLGPWKIVCILEPLKLLSLFPCLSHDSTVTILAIIIISILVTAMSS